MVPPFHSRPRERRERKPSNHGCFVIGEGMPPHAGPLPNEIVNFNSMAEHLQDSAFSRHRFGPFLHNSINGMARCLAWQHGEECGFYPGSFCLETITMGGIARAILGQF